MIPEPTPGAVLFNPPPGWAVPNGFDPRRGHLVDPAWPSPPNGWSFWVPDPAGGRERASLPTAVLPQAPEERRRANRRLAIALGGTGVVLAAVLWWAVTDSQGPGVGSCWTTAGDDWLEEVSCDGAAVDFVVVERTTSPDACPASAWDYLELGSDVLCLARR